MKTTNGLFYWMVEILEDIKTADDIETLDLPKGTINQINSALDELKRMRQQNINKELEIILEDLNGNM